MKFNEFMYVRPDLEKTKKDLESLIAKINDSKTPEEQVTFIKDFYKSIGEFYSMGTLSGIRYSINTSDDFYSDEKEFFDNAYAEISNYTTNFYKALVNSKFKDELTKTLGDHLFSIADFATKSFIPEIVEDLKEESKISTEYMKLLASAKIPFEGEERNLSELIPFMQSNDRNIRKKASEARWGFFKENEEKFDSLYDSLVKVRTRIAKKMGFKSFTELGYIRMNRFDYTPEMVTNFRKQVVDYIVPLCSKLYERQRKRLGLETLYYYDEDFNFNSGNAIPKYPSKELVELAVKMYDELSPETSEYFRFMVEHELMDLVSKKSKAGGGFCTYISKYRAPFIFSNFNGTSGDIDVLTHEAGHAFQTYLNRDIEIDDYSNPTLESCEIHSMSMEFITYPWMELFFKEEADKYRFAHLASAVEFIPYGVMVDEFQHLVYDNPEATPKERKTMWRDLEKKYLPHRNYGDNEFLEEGAFWQKQAHIYEMPFYYIDYTLAEICALQFFKKCQDDRKSAWTDYLNYTKEGGKYPFTKLIKFGNLKSPFEDGCVSSIISDIENYLNSVDDSKF